MAEYFLSNSGNDNNAGTSPTAPWATLAKVAAFPFKAGDVLNLRCGDIWYGKLVLGGTAAQKPALPVVVGNYGQGDLPKVHGYKIIKPSSWVSHAANIWKMNINSPTEIEGNISSVGADGANIGFLRVDGVIKGAKKWAIGDLTADWQFYSDEAAGVLYVRRGTNPGIGTKEILAAPRTTEGLLPRRFNSEIYGIEVAGTGGHGWQGHATLSDVKGSGNVFKEIGGSRLTGTTRYGNGIECFGGGKRIDWSGNEFIDIYDVAGTWQGYPNVVATDGWEDCHFDRNVIRRCNQGFEIWATYGTTSGLGTPAAGAGYRRCTVKGNLFVDSGLGWAAEVRPDTSSRSPLLVYNIEVDTVDIEVCDNTYVDWHGPWIFSNVRTVADLISRGLKLHDETLVVGPGRKVEHQRTETVEDFATWAAALGVKGCSVQVTSDNLSATLDTLVTRSADSITALSAMAKVSRKNALQTVGEARGARARAEALTGLAVSMRQGRGGFRTLETTVAGANSYAKIATGRTTSNSHRINMSFFYMLADDSGDTGKAIGIGRVKVDANSELTGITADSTIQVFPMMGFNSASMGVADFVGVVTKADGAEVVVDIYFNVGKDNYSKLTVLPLATSVGTYSWVDFIESEPLIPTLPTGIGTNLVGKDTYSLYHKKPTSGVGAPTSVPEYIGQEYVDYNARVTYRAMATTSASDWKAEALELRQGKGRYRTAASSSPDGTAAWAKIATIRTVNQFARINAALFYMFGDDGGDTGRAIGVVRLKIDPNAGLTGLTADSRVQVAPLMDFNPQRASSVADFVAVVSVADGAQVIVDLYYNVGQDSYSTLSVTPLAVSTPTLTGSFELLDSQALIPSLPAGVGPNLVGSDTFMATIKKPTTGTVAPTSTPQFIGQEYIDTSAKKMYKAMGTASSADWVILN